MALEFNTGKFIYITILFPLLQIKVQKMVDEADKDGTGLLTEKEFMQSNATEVRVLTYLC